MKISTLAISSLLVIGVADAFLSNSRTAVSMKVADVYDMKNQKGVGATSTYLHSLAPMPSKRGGKSEEEIQVELSSGKVMEGGKVIDFEAIKGPSHAEQALQGAKDTIVSSGEKYIPPGNGILGINDDVVSEVGHELGQFATPGQIQLCAAYLRSKAPKSLFETNPNSINREESSFSEEEKNTIDSILRKAYVESGEVTSAFAKTFFLGTQLLPELPREAIWAIYVWCRRTDEIVDAPRDSDEEMLNDLGSWEMRLEALWKHGEVEDVYDLCLLDVLVRYPNLPITPFTDMIRGMLMDVPGLGQERYESFDELHLYCYRVAGTVGLMSLPVFGCAEGYNDQIAREPALSLGVAFQLTNILRDVGEDAEKRGRVYLPREDMATFGVTEEQILAKKVDQNYVDFMKFQIERAKMYYERARRGVFMLAPESRLPVQSSLDAYGKILDKIEENGYDSLTTRAYVGKWEKLSMIPMSWYKTQDISRTLPFPGDKPVPTLDEPTP